MSTPAAAPYVVPVSIGLSALHNARELAAQEIAAAVQRVLPRGFRARITLHVDGGVVRPQDVTIELRPAQK